MNLMSLTGSEVAGEKSLMSEGDWDRLNECINDETFRNILASYAAEINENKSKIEIETFLRNSEEKLNLQKLPSSNVTQRGRKQKEEKKSNNKQTYHTSQINNTNNQDDEKKVASESSSLSSLPSTNNISIHSSNVWNKEEVKHKSKIVSTRNKNLIIESGQCKELQPSPLQHLVSPTLEGCSLSSGDGDVDNDTHSNGLSVDNLLLLEKSNTIVLSEKEQLKATQTNHHIYLQNHDMAKIENMIDISNPTNTCNNITFSNNNASKGTIDAIPVATTLICKNESISEPVRLLNWLNLFQ